MPLLSWASHVSDQSRTSLLPQNSQPVLEEETTKDARNATLGLSFCFHPHYIINYKLTFSGVLN